MQGDPKVIDALKTCAFNEITVYETFHAMEHLFERRQYGKIAEFCDKQVKRSRVRRRYLTDRIFELDGTFQLALAPSALDAWADPQAVFTTAQGLAATLLASYQAAHEVAQAAKDFRTAINLTKSQSSVEKLLIKLEAYAGQIDELGGMNMFLLAKI